MERAGYERLPSREEIQHKSRTPLSISQLILGIVMAVIGYKYSWYYHMGGHDEDNLCPNGAAWWLWVAGMILMVSELIHLCCGKRLDIVMFILDVAMLIWGSVLVFGAWASWTSDYDAYKTHPEELNFCEYTPMMTAFIILLLRWVLVPAIFCCMCGCLCCAGCCLASAEAGRMISENSARNMRNLGNSKV